MNNQIPGIYNSLQEIAWQFGSHGLNGECCEDLSFIEFMALKKVYENAEISVQEIGNYLNITKSGATKITNRLGQKGYVTKKTSAADGRVCCVCTTGKGTEVIKLIIGRYIDHLDQILKDMEPGTINEVKSVLKLLIDSMNK